MLVLSHRICRAGGFDRLDKCRRVSQPAPAFQGVAKPLRWEIWQEALIAHPDREMVDYIVTGLREGFRIGYNYQAHKCKRSEDNMRSAKDHPQVVDSYIRKECEAGRLLGPFDPDLFPAVQISRFRVIPKSEPDSWRLILDLSYPEGRSVNDGISPANLLTVIYDGRLCSKGNCVNGPRGYVGQGGH